jgi:hypothetical protein
MGNAWLHQAHPAPNAPETFKTCAKQIQWATLGSTKLTPNSKTGRTGDQNARFEPTRPVGVASVSKCSGITKSSKDSGFERRDAGESQEACQNASIFFKCRETKKKHQKQNYQRICGLQSAGKMLAGIIP